MKRILLLFIVAFSVICLQGCSKELKSISGTIWEKMESDTIVTLSFTDIQCECKMSSASNPSKYVYSYYSYEYSPSTVMMYPEDDDLAMLKGIISENTMSLVNMSTQKTIGIFTKR